MTEPVGSEAFGAALQEVESLSPELVSQSDVAVRLIEAVSTQKVTRLRWIQGIFLISALGLLAAGAWMVRNSVIQPLANLEKVANRIGNGDLSTPVEKAGPDEIQTLQGSFEGMRSQLLESQRETRAGTELLEQRVAQRTQELEALVSVSGEITSRLAIQDVFLSNESLDVRGTTRMERKHPTRPSVLSAAGTDCVSYFLGGLKDYGQRHFEAATAGLVPWWPRKVGGGRPRSENLI